MYYWLQSNQYWIIYLITYIGQYLYHHNYWVCSGVNLFKCHWIIQDITSNTVIKYGSTANHKSIVRYIGWSQPNFHVLDGPGFTSKDERNRKTHHCTGRGFIIFTFLANNRFIYIFSKVISVICLKPLCCIFGTPFLSLFLILVRLLSHPQPFLAGFLCHNLVENIYALFSFILWSSFIMNTSYFQMENW